MGDFRVDCRSTVYPETVTAWYLLWINIGPIAILKKLLLSSIRWQHIYTIWAAIARDNAQVFAAGDWAHTAGLWHDL